MRLAPRRLRLRLPILQQLLRLLELPRELLLLRLHLHQQQLLLLLVLPLLLLHNLLQLRRRLVDYFSKLQIHEHQPRVLLVPESVVEMLQLPLQLLFVLLSLKLQLLLVLLVLLLQVLLQQVLLVLPVVLH